ncbi:DNA-damage-inducible protein D [compost metagenome]
MTGINVLNKDLKGYNPIENEHVDNNSAVRKMLLERGIKPETLPPAEDVKKVQRKLKGDSTKLLKGPGNKKQAAHPHTDNLDSQN